MRYRHVARKRAAETPKLLGLTIPPSLLRRADQVIEYWTGERLLQ